MITISDYGTLKLAIEEYLARGDISSYIPLFVQQAETRINTLRVREFESAFSQVISGGVLSVPSDYMEIKSFRIDGYKPLRRSSLTQLYHDFPLRSDTGIPTTIARENNSFIFGPSPDSDYTVQGIYYAKPSALTSDSDAPALLLRSPSLYLFGALAAAKPFLGDDPNAAIWLAAFDNEYGALKSESRMEDISGDTLVMTRG